MKKHLPEIILILIFLAGLSLLLYPSVSDYWNSMHQTKIITDYAKNVQSIDDETYQKILDAAHEYNAALSNDPSRFLPSDESKALYNSVLNISGDGMMGYIEIPVLRSKLAVYHGTDDAVLQSAIGHIEGTSLPVGGESTHAVLSGHRGLPSARLFTDLDKIVEGDIFMLHIMDETMTYQVDQIRIVLPSEVKGLAIEAGKDYCTLVTCTPYGVNSHRMLIRGHRVENIKNSSTVRVTADAYQIEPMIIAPIIGVPILIVFLLVLLGKSRKNRRNRRKDLDIHDK